MDLLQAIEQAESDLDSTLVQLQEARDLVALLAADSKKMRVEIAGLKAFATRNGLTEPAPSSIGADAEVVPISADIDLSPDDELDLASMSRTDAVLAVMAASAEPIDRATIHEGFHDGGRYDDELDEVSLTLSGLKRSGRVEKLGHGLWQIVETQISAELG